MANSDKPNGMKPVRYLNGAPYTGAFRTYFIPSSDSTAVFVGDGVKLAGSADAEGVPTVAQSAATNAMCGVVVGFAPDPTDLNVPIYRRASTDRYVYVVDDPNVLFEIKCDDVGSTLAAADIGLNASIVVGSGSTTTGASGVQLDTSTKATTATLELKIMELARRVDNELGSAHQKVIVKINNHQFGSHTGTAGV